MWQYLCVFLLILLIICFVIMIILIKRLKRIKIKKGSISCEFNIYELFLINECLGDELAGLELYVENLPNKLICSSTDVTDCEDIYNRLEEVEDLKNKVYCYMDFISKKE